MDQTTPGRLLLAARTRSALSQRDLARRAGTSQSVVARIENGDTSPSWATLERLVHAAGQAIAAQLVAKHGTDESVLDDVPRILSLSAEQRLREVAQVARFIANARRA